MKKILSFILAALMTASCAAYVAADDAAVEETTSNAAQDYAIEFLANYGIFKGYSAEDTGAEDLIQRYQMALFVSRISTGWTEDDKWEDGTANNATFKDIDDEPANKYLGALSYANQNGIIEGYTANTFAPYANITYRDALTMVVRTLGYKGLTYPWGYIEKAVELDLTEGIDSDVAYTDDLTRGEVATIIYNAMFATTSKGNTLAKSIFDIDFKWQNIVVVSTDEYTTIYDAEGKGVFAKEGYVGFKTIDSKTAALGDKVYYVKSEDMGLNGHEEEQAVGCVFTALFESVDGNYVTMVDVDSAKIATVFNNGITDNDGNPYETMPIAKYLSDNKHATVKDYTDNVVNYEYADLKVFGYEDRVVYDLDGNKTYVGIDFVTKNILKYDENAKKWVVEWLYNDTLEKYYQYTVKAADSSKVSQTVNTANTGDVYINWMSDAEFTEWYNEVIKDAVASYSELTLLKASATTMLEGKAPYAKLALFDIDNDAKAEVANYKTYGIGIFTNTTKKCATGDALHAANAEMPAYKLTDLDGGNENVIFVEAGHEKHDTNKEAGFAWVTVDPSVTGFVKEDGTYNNGVVLYNWNKTTGEIEVVKYITKTATDDADSYIVTGILQAYNAAKQTVTISGVNYPIAYANLIGDMYKMANAGVAESARIGAILDEQYMQYVEAVVCDGYVVDTDLVGADADFIVVLGYAGITSDGYIAVYGYSTDDATMKVFKINSYNGWKQGDYRYYPTNAAEDEAFQYGTLYQIKSYDAETESYGVYTENVSSALENASPVKITFEDGYRIIQPMTINYKNGQFYYAVKKDADGKDVSATVTKVDDKDNYVVVTDADNGMDVNSNIYTYTGKINWQRSFYGLLVNTGVDKKFVIYASSEVYDESNTNVANFLPFFTDNAYQIGFVLYEKVNGSVISAAYDEAIAGDYYLLGSTASEVRVMNLLTGNRDVVIASSNIDLINGHIYKTVGGTILADMTDICNEHDHYFTGAIHDAYRSYDLDYATYSVVENNYMKGSELFVDSDKDGKLDTMNTLELAKAMRFVTGNESYAAAKAKELVKGITLYVVDEEYSWYAGHNGTIVEALAAKDVKADYTYVVDFIYEVSSGKLVGYIYDISEKDIEGIIAPNTKSFTATVYQGGSDLTTKGGYEPKLTEWHLTTADDVEDDTERYFDIETKVTLVVGYKDEDCSGSYDYVELTNIEQTLVEIVPVYDTDGKTIKSWKAVPVNECADGNEIHDALAELGMCFGNAKFNNDNAIVSVEGFDFTDDAVVVYNADCGLAYKVVVNTELYMTGDSASVGVVAGNITTNFGIDLHYIENHDVTTEVMDGMFNTLPHYSRNGGSYKLSDKPEADDSIIVIG